MSAIRTAAVVGICIAPSAAFSIWPKLAAIASGSAALDGATAAFLIFQTAVTVVMAMCFPAMERTTSWLKKLAALSLGLFLGVIQFLNALEVASHSRDDKAAVARGAMNGTAALERQLAELTNSRQALPQHTPATAAMVEAATAAVTAAAKSREDECRSRGTFCRQREDAERQARAELGKVQEQKALTDQAAQLDADIRAIRGRIDAAGPAPKYEDGAAWRIGAILARFGVPMGDDPGATVTEWWPAVQALAVELLALLGPYIILTETDWPARSRRARGWPAAGLRRRSPAVGDAETVMPAASRPAAEAPAAVRTAAVTRAAATAEKSRKAKANKPTAVGPVREWHEERTVGRTGHDLRAGEAFESYTAWCNERGQPPMNLTAFGNCMRDDLKVEKFQTPSKRTYYRNITLRSRPTLAVVVG
jgi:hypothetical protein